MSYNPPVRMLYGIQTPEDKQDPFEFDKNKRVDPKPTHTHPEIAVLEERISNLEEAIVKLVSKL